MDLVPVNFGADQHRQLPFLLSLFGEKKAPFAILTRYYIFSLITGAHHLFVFGRRPKKEVRELFFLLSKENEQPNIH